MKGEETMNEVLQDFPNVVEYTAWNSVLIKHGIILASDNVNPSKRSEPRRGRYLGLGRYGDGDDQDTTIIIIDEQTGITLDADVTKVKFIARLKER